MASDHEEYDAEGNAGHDALGLALLVLCLTAVTAAGWMLTGVVGAVGLAVVFVAALLAWPGHVGTVIAWVCVAIMWAGLGVGVAIAVAGLGALWLAGMIALLVLGVVVFMVSPVVGWIMVGAWAFTELDRRAAEHAELAAERAVARLRHGAPDV